MKKKLALISLLFVLLQSCSYLVPEPSIGHKSDNYRFSASIILINSLCNKYESTPLKYLLDNLLMGIKEVKIQGKETIQFAKREALKAKATGVLDGVKVHALIQTVRKNHCVYDFVFISHKIDQFERHKTDYLKLLKTVEID